MSFRAEKAVLLATLLVKKMEGLRLESYKDGKGVWTIGYGTTLIDGHKVMMGTSCTEEQADQWLSKRISSDALMLDRICQFHEIDLEDHQAAALLSFVYNVGFVAFNSSSVCKDLMSKKPEKVEKDLLKWNKIRIDEKLEFCPGLFNRRMQEDKCFIDEKLCG